MADQQQPYNPNFQQQQQQPSAPYDPQFQQPQPQPGYQPQPGQAPPPQQGYPQPTYPQQPMGQPMGQPMMAPQQAGSNVIVVQAQPTPGQTTVVAQKEKVNHILHLVISCFCPCWIFVWMILCCIHGC